MPPTTSFTRSSKRRWLIGGLIGAGAVIALIVLIAITVNAEESESDRQARSESLIRDILKRVPLIDGHNDLPYVIRKLFNNKLEKVNLSLDLTTLEPWKSCNESHTDIPRLRQGGVGAQFWSAYTKCLTQYKSALQITLEQIDVIHRFVKMYPNDFEFVTTAKGIEDAHTNGKIGSLIGVEGGHSIDSSIGVLRLMYNLGVRYMTLTHNCNTPWADNNLNTTSPEFSGLSPFGKRVVQEMNRLGMIVDISHVAFQTMHTVFDITKAPVMFSHSGAYAVCNHTRNVPDELLLRLKENGGIIMIYFVVSMVSCSKNATLSDVADHFDHVKKVIGVDNIGIGGDYNGIDSLPVGLEDVSTFPKLLEELLNRGWTTEELEKITGKNFLRVFREVEKVKESMHNEPAVEDWIPLEEITKRTNCSNLWPTY